MEEVQERVQQVRCGARTGTSRANSMTKHAAVDLILAAEEEALTSSSHPRVRCGRTPRADGST